MVCLVFLWIMCLRKHGSTRVVHEYSTRFLSREQSFSRNTSIICGIFSSLLSGIVGLLYMICVNQRLKEILSKFIKDANSYMTILTKLLSHKNGTVSAACSSNYLSKSLSLEMGCFFSLISTYMYMDFFNTIQPAIWDTERITTCDNANNKDILYGLKCLLSI